MEMNVEIEWKYDSELQLIAGDRLQVNPIKAGIKPQDKSLYQFFSLFSLTTKWSLNRNTSR
jgi:hypothetical protein